MNQSMSFPHTVVDSRAMHHAQDTSLNGRTGANAPAIRVYSPNPQGPVSSTAAPRAFVPFMRLAPVHVVSSRNGVTAGSPDRAPQSVPDDSPPLVDSHAALHHAHDAALLQVDDRQSERAQDYWPGLAEAGDRRRKKAVNIDLPAPKEPRLEAGGRETGSFVSRRTCRLRYEIDPLQQMSQVAHAIQLDFDIDMHDGVVQFRTKCAAPKGCEFQFQHFVVNILFRDLLMMKDPVEVDAMLMAQAISKGCLDLADSIARLSRRAVRQEHASDVALIERVVQEDRHHLLSALIGQGADITTPDRNGSCLLHHAITVQARKVLELLAVPPAIDHIDGNGNTPLHLALSHCDSLGIVTTLAMKGANPELKNRAGETALIHATKKGKNWEIAVLLRVGAIPNAPDRSGNTPLQYACATGNQTAILLLTALGANVRSVITGAPSLLDIADAQGMRCPQATYLLRRLDPDRR